MLSLIWMGCVRDKRLRSGPYRQIYPPVFAHDHNVGGLFLDVLRFELECMLNKYFVYAAKGRRIAMRSSREQTGVFSFFLLVKLIGRNPDT